MTNPNKRATLTSVAQAAGVSVSTASRVLNQNDKTIPISQKTKDKVLGVARELGYMPSMAARALRSGSTKTIGVLGSSPTFFLREGDLSNQHVSFVNEIMRGLINSTVERGYNLTLLTGAELKNVTEMELLGSFGMVDGMIVLNRDLSAEDLLTHTLSSYPKPLVYALDYQDDDEFVTAADDLAGGELATTQDWMARFAPAAMPRLAGDGVHLVEAELDATRMSNGWQRIDAMQWLFTDAASVGVDRFLDQLAELNQAGVPWTPGRGVPGRD